MLAVFLSKSTFAWRLKVRGLAQADSPKTVIVRFIVGSRFDPEPTPRTQIRCQRLFHFTERFDDRTRLVAFASGALFNGQGEDRFDSAQLPQFCLNQT